jgi:molecular chaperone GrpE
MQESQPVPEDIEKPTDAPEATAPETGEGPKASEPTENPPETDAAEVDPMEALQAEVGKWKDLAYRSQAELDNFRKRAAREAQDTRAYANADLLRALLPILDNFQMGLDAAKAESEKSVIYVGMNMVQRQILDFLRDSGVQEVEAADKPFDPNLHDAVSQEASETVAEGTVIKVTRRGFQLRDRLLRAASVVVSSGPPSADTGEGAST